MFTCAKFLNSFLLPEWPKTSAEGKTTNRNNTALLPFCLHLFLSLLPLNRVLSPFCFICILFLITQGSWFLYISSVNLETFVGLKEIVRWVCRLASGIASWTTKVEDGWTPSYPICLPSGCLLYTSFPSKVSKCWFHLCKNIFGLGKGNSNFSHSYFIPYSQISFNDPGGISVETDISSFSNV